MGNSDRRVWYGAAALALLLVVGGGVFVSLGGGPGGADAVDGKTPNGRQDPPGEIDDPGDADRQTPGEGNDVTVIEGEGSTTGGADAGSVGSSTGPVGSVTATDLNTTPFEPPAGPVSLVSPRFSPDGLRILAASGRAASASVWVIEVDNPERGWERVPSKLPVTDPVWLDEYTLAMVKENRLVSHKIGGRTFALVDERDEPGKVMQPVGAPNNELVAYVSLTSANGGGDIRLLDRSTKVIRNITATRAKAAEPAWRADSKAVVGTLNQQVTAWALDSSDTLHSYTRDDPAKTPGWWGDAIQWQEGESFAVNLVIAEPTGEPRIIARRALASVARPAPIAGGFVWLSSLTERGTLWAVRKDGSGVVLDSDADFASQPDVVQRKDGLWVAFTSSLGSTGVTRIHIAKIDPAALRVE